MLARNLPLSMEEYEALSDALDAYLNGNGMSDGDPAEAALEAIADRL